MTLDEWLTLCHAVNAYAFVLVGRDGEIATTCEHLAEAVTQTYDLDQPVNRCIVATLMKFKHLPLHRKFGSAWQLAVK